MSSPTDPLLLAGVATGAVGLFLIAQARMQSRLLRSRIATGTGTEVYDAATGLFAAPAMWQCIRAEANRATRLERDLHIWVGSAVDEPTLDASGTELAFQLPAGATGVRLNATQVCIVSCADTQALPERTPDLAWRSAAITPAADTARDALAFVTEVSHAA